MSDLNQITEQSKAIALAYHQSVDRWQGCDWPVSFGPLGLNLNGMKPRQTRLLAEATSGEESNSWNDATQWLREIARDAANAQTEAAEAVMLWKGGQFAESLSRIEAAVAIEAKYRNPVTWKPLRDAIARGVNESSD